MTPDGVARGGLKDGTDERASHFRREDDGNSLGGNAPRAETANRAACGFLPDGFGGFEIAEAARSGPPAIALHVAVAIHGQRSCGDTGVAGAIAAHKAT